ncbi:hypothetical protein ScPMuIL_007939 [Solemya velum]
MGMKGCGNFLKYTMFIFNAIILLAGCGLLAFGIYTRTNQYGMQALSSLLGDNLILTISLALIVTGCVVIIISFLGCCGSIKEVKCMLMGFFVLLLILFITFLIGGILAYTLRSKIESFTLKQMRVSLNSSYGFDLELTDAWDSMQKLFGCCGVQGEINSTESWAYYKTYTYWFSNQTVDRQYVPDSCCKAPGDTPNRTKCIGHASVRIAPVAGPPVTPMKENDQLMTEGCFNALLRFVEDNTKVLSGVAVGIAVLMVLGMTFALCLYRRIQDEYEYDR